MAVCSSCFGWFARSTCQHVPAPERGIVRRGVFAFWVALGRALLETQSVRRPVACVHAMPHPLTTTVLGPGMTGHPRRGKAKTKSTSSAMMSRLVARARPAAGRRACTYASITTCSSTTRPQCYHFSLRENTHAKGDACEFTVKDF